MLVGKAEHARHFLGLAAHGDEIGAQRLHGAGIVPGAAGQSRRLAVPAPRHGEARERFRAHRAFHRRFAPALAAVGGDQHFLDASGARIGDAGNLVKARALHGVTERRLGDEGFHLVDEVELVGLAVGQQRRVVARLVIGHGRLIDDLQPAQEFHVHVAFVAGQQQPHRVAVAGHDALAVLVERDDGVVVGLLQRHAAADRERVRRLPPASMSPSGRRRLRRAASTPARRSIPRTTPGRAAPAAAPGSAPARTSARCCRRTRRNACASPSGNASARRG